MEAHVRRNVKYINPLPDQIGFNIFFSSILLDILSKHIFISRVYKEQYDSSFFNYLKLLWGWESNICTTVLRSRDNLTKHSCLGSKCSICTHGNTNITKNKFSEKIIYTFILFWGRIKIIEQ